MKYVHDNIKSRIRLTMFADETNMVIGEEDDG
jgi:hypothetical protein